MSGVDVVKLFQGATLDAHERLSLEVQPCFAGPQSWSIAAAV